MTRALLKSTSVVSAMTLLSRVLGFARDILFARFFGAGLVMDAFFVAFKIPNFMRRLFAEGAFSQAFVPVLAEYKSQKPGEVNELLDRVSGALGLVLLGVTIIGVIAAPVLVFVFAPGFWADGERFELATGMLRWTFPYLLFISLTALAGGVLNTWGRFGVPAFTPVLLNLSLIGAALYIAPLTANPGLGLAIGVFIAGVAQLAFQVPFLARLKLLPKPKSPFAARSAPPTALHPGVRKIMRLMGPAIFGSSVAQINLLIDTLIASFLVAGSVSWLYYSDRLMEFPLGVFGIALATVILPGLSSKHAEQSPEGFAAMLDWALRLVCVIAVPAAVGLFVLAGPVLATLFQYGSFGAHDAAMAELSLMAYAFGLLGFTLVKVLVPGYFARQDTRTPVRYGVIALGANMALNVAIVVPWVMLGYIGPHAGLALATSIAAFLNAGLLFRGLRRDGVLRFAPGWKPLLFRTALASLAMAAAVLWYAGALADWLALAGGERIIRLLAAVSLGIGVYAAVLWLAGLRPHHLKVSV